MMPCNTCRDLQPPDPSLRIPFSKLEESARKASCQSCRLILDAIRIREEDKIFIEYVDIYISTGQGTLTLSLWPWGSSRGNSVSRRSMFLHVLQGTHSGSMSLLMPTWLGIVLLDFEG